MPYGRTDGLTLKDSATQLLIKYKSGALVTQQQMSSLILLLVPVADGLQAADKKDEKSKTRL